VRVSLHAKQRWRQRAPDVDMTKDLLTAKPVSKRLLRVLNDPNNTGVKGMRGPQVMRYMVTEGRMILVVSLDGTIVTVVSLDETKAWIARRERTLRRVRRYGNLN
jgi:hypothetical protein